MDISYEVHKFANVKWIKSEMSKRPSNEIKTDSSIERKQNKTTGNQKETKKKSKKTWTF